MDGGAQGRIEHVVLDARDVVVCALRAHRQQSHVWLTFVLLACGLMSKPMLVTMPFVLAVDGLLAVATDAVYARPYVERPNRFVCSLFVEKIPFFVLSFLLCLVTFNIQKEGGAMQATDHAVGLTHQ